VEEALFLTRKPKVLHEVQVHEGELSHEVLILELPHEARMLLRKEVREAIPVRQTDDLFLVFETVILRAHHEVVDFHVEHIHADRLEDQVLGAEVNHLHTTVVRHEEVAEVVVFKKLLTFQNLLIRTR
jgi:hypothetical protein